MSAKREVLINRDLLDIQCQHGLADFVATTYSSIWETRGYDMELRQTLTATLKTIAATGVVGHVCGRSQLVHINPGENTIELKNNVLKELRRMIASQRLIRYNKPMRFTIDDKYSGILVIFPEGRANESEPWSIPRDADFHYCSLLYTPSAVFRKSYAVEQEDRFSNFHANSTLPLYFDLFRHRERRFAPFAAKLSERYWEDSTGLLCTSKSLCEGFRPPWEGANNVHRTATLCLDLRKSTFCMEHADQPKEFGQWLDSLVKVITNVCHEHGGIFDKFTGDGGLIHFLDRECEDTYHRSAVVCAVECARSLQIEIGKLLERLRQFIRFDSSVLGAGVAIDVGEAFWSLDHRDNPIVVGRAVVGACRVCDGAKAGKIRLTNIACKQLPKPLLLDLLENQLTKVTLSTKELDKSMEILVWEF